MNPQDLVPPLELCKLIPKGEFTDTCFIWDKTPYMAFTDGVNEQGDFVGRYGKVIPEFYKLRKNYNKTEKQVKIDFCFEPPVIELDYFPAPTLQEILEELPWDFEFSHCYEGVPTEKYITIIGTEIGEVGDNGVESAMKTWLEYKGIKNA